MKWFNNLFKRKEECISLETLRKLKLVETIIYYIRDNPDCIVDFDTTGSYGIYIINFMYKNEKMSINTQISRDQWNTVNLYFGHNYMTKGKSELILDIWFPYSEYREIFFDIKNKYLNRELDGKNAKKMVNLIKLERMVND